MPSSAADRVFFVEPHDAAIVHNPINVTFGVEGMTHGLEGDMRLRTGHHHLIVDGAPVAAGLIVPNDATHMHFGQGQTSTRLVLPPGQHYLTLQFADGEHRSYGPTLSNTIGVMVK